MRRRRTEPVLIFSAGTEELEAFVTHLNTEFICVDSRVEGGTKRTLADNRFVRRELRRLVEAWIDSGPNVLKLINADPVLARAARKFWAHLVPTQKGYARLAYYPIPENLPKGSPLSAALALFMSFLLNPCNDRLGGPCGRCRNYYVKKTKRQTVYCSNGCGKRYTARRTNENRRKQEHAKQLATAQRYASQWATTKTELKWKDWVFRRSRISKNWLTRVVKSGELSEPIRRV